MGTLTDVQIIKQDGKPAFAIIPYEDYLSLLPKDRDASIPHEVVGLIVKKGMNLVKAWRIHLGFTQREVAERAEILIDAHERFRKVLGGKRFKVVEPVLPMDLMGIYILLPDRGNQGGA